MCLIMFNKIDDGTLFKFIMQDFKIYYEMLVVLVIHESTEHFLFNFVKDGTYFISILHCHFISILI